MLKLPECPACCEKRIHSEAEWKLHPDEGHMGIDWNIPIKAEPITERREDQR